MSTAEDPEFSAVLDRVKTWPVPLRIALARHILESIEGQPLVDPPSQSRSLRDLVGLLKTDSPPPTDEECRAILEDELIKKYFY